MKKLILLGTLLVSSALITISGQTFEELAPTPPMGWNSWNKFGCDVNEKLIMEIADAMVESGMQEAGYEYIVIDDCWQIDRDEKGNIVPDPERFPSGMKALADYIHSRGLKFGIYSCAGSMTCQQRPGSRGYQFQDALQYAEWNVDYLKYDWCLNEGQNAEAAYKTMSDALKACGRPIVFSICEWGSNEPWKWAKGIGHLWRTTADIQDCFDCVSNWGGIGVLQILDIQVGLEKYAGPGHWNDPDMLEVGNGGMTYSEYRAHFSLWCMLAAPLMAGNDLRNMDEETRQILTRKEVIKINQDTLGIQAFKYLALGDLEVWVKPLENGEAAFCFLNRGDQTADLDFDWHKFGIYHRSLKKSGFSLSREYRIIDLWDGKNLGTTSQNLVAKIRPHDVLLIKCSNR